MGGWCLRLGLIALLMALPRPARGSPQEPDKPKDFESDEEPQEKAEKKGKKDKKKKRKVRFLLQNRPQLRVGKVLRVDFRAKIQADHRTYYPFHLTDEGDFELHRVRVGIQGRLFKDFEFEVEREINEEASDWLNLDHETVGFPWRDVYVNWRHFRRVQFQVGKFKCRSGWNS